MGMTIGPWTHLTMDAGISTADSLAWLAQHLPVAPHTFMLAVGVIEIVAGLLVLVRPQIGAYVVALWLVGIIINLLIGNPPYDVALRDFGLMLGALALGRLSHEFGDVLHLWR